ncbi:MAG: phosphoribosylanthranilate isomerase [Treponema sp.]|jgi:phosphoribosylanthranilate isomerase|nr:phosphoribosylanthranilate isomerase [Treponema sp.]
MKKQQYEVVADSACNQKGLIYFRRYCIKKHDVASEDAKSFRAVSAIMVKIKICGLFRDEDIDYANEAAPDYIGFVFAPKSRRRVSPGAAAAFREKLRDGIVPVGVFVNAAVDEIAALYRDGVIAAAQLHGGEKDEYVSRLRERCGAPLIRAVRSEDLEDTARSAVPDSPSALSRFSVAAGCLLIDNGDGGTGQSFDWRRLDVLRNPACRDGEAHPPRDPVPFFLAGGIGLHNIDAALACRPYAVDVSSGAETDGVKDREKMLRLVEKVRGSPAPRRAGKG